MKANKELIKIPDDLVMTKIYYIRDQKVMIDKDLAELYSVQTKVFNQTIKRNLSRFPPDFMFELTETEFNSLRSQIVTSKSGRGGRRYLPMAFTEQGVAMLASILNSDNAISINIQIIRVFTRIRKMFIDNTELHLAIEEIRKRQITIQKILKSFLNTLMNYLIKKKTNLPGN